MKVALLEAGGADTDDEIHIPAAFGALFKGRRDWDMSSEPEPASRRPSRLPAAGQDARRLQLDERDGLHPRQPRRLRRMGRAGRRGLGLRRRAAVLQALRGQRARRGSLPRRRRAAARPRGPLDEPARDAFVEAAKQAGHEENPDFNGARQEGFGRYQTTQENGMRASTSVRYLHPTMGRENLTVITDAHALRILFDGDRASRSGGRSRGNDRGGGGLPRGHRLGRRLSVPAAADALRHRAGGAAAAVRDRGSPGPPGRRGPTGPLHDADELEDRLRVADDGAHAREHRAAADRGTRPAVLERRRGRRLRAHAPGPRRARLPVPLRAGAVPRGRPRCGARARHRRSARAS